MVIYNVTCNVPLEFEKKWLEWIDEKLNDLSNSIKINVTSILKLNITAPLKDLFMPFTNKYRITIHLATS